MRIRPLEAVCIGLLVIVAGAIIAATRPSRTDAVEVGPIVEAIVSSKGLTPEQAKTIPPVTRTSLEAKGLRKLFGGNGFRDLPFSVTPEEEAAVQECRRIAQRARQFVDGKSRFDADGTGRDLETILDEQPNLFYAEYLLARWYQKQDEGEADAARWLRRAYEHAPVILVQRFAYADGEPVANVPIQSLEIECNRVKDGSLNPELQLEFGDLLTDEAGCVYVPVYRTVYRRAGYSYPPDHDTESDRLGWFDTRGRIAEMPVIRCRKRGDVVVTRDKLTPARARLRLSHKPGDERLSVVCTITPLDPKAQRLVHGWYVIDVVESRVTSMGGLTGGGELAETPMQLEITAEFGGRSGTSINSGSNTTGGFRKERVDLKLPLQGERGRFLVNEGLSELTQEPVPLWIAVDETNGEPERIIVHAACVVGHGNEGKDARFASPDLKADTLLNREVLRLVKRPDEAASQPEAASNN